MKIRLLPGGPGTGYIFENRTVDGAIPNEFIKPIDEGINEELTRGVLGYPVDDVRIELYDGSFHDIDSSEMAFKIAGSMAFHDAAKKAEPVLLEPVMLVEVVVQKAHMSDVTGDLLRRRGQNPLAGRPRQNVHRLGARADVGDVRLRDRPPLTDTRGRELLDALRSIRTAKRPSGY